MIDFCIQVIIVFQKEMDFSPITVMVKIQKQDTLSIENQKINHATQRFSKLSGNVAPVMLFSCIVRLVY